MDLSRRSQGLVFSIRETCSLCFVGLVFGLQITYILILFVCKWSWVICGLSFVLWSFLLTYSDVVWRNPGFMNDGLDDQGLKEYILTFDDIVNCETRQDSSQVLGFAIFSGLWRLWSVSFLHLLLWKGWRRESWPWFYRLWWKSEAGKNKLWSFRTSF